MVSNSVQLPAFNIGRHAIRIPRKYDWHHKFELFQTDLKTPATVTPADQYQLELFQIDDEPAPYLVTLNSMSSTESWLEHLTDDPAVCIWHFHRGDNILRPGEYQLRLSVLINSSGQREIACYGKIDILSGSE